MYTVVIIEDDPMITRLNRRYVEQDSRFAVVQTFSAAHPALFWLQHNPIDLIILDVMMPKIDGLQACMRIREFSDVPIIMLTAKSEDSDKVLGLSMGADDYITKPFSAAYLKARTENLLMQRKKLQALYCQSLLAVNPNKNEQKEAEEFLSEQDHKFMDKLLQLMEQQIGNGELTVDSSRISI